MRTRDRAFGVLALAVLLVGCGGQPPAAVSTGLSRPGASPTSSSPAGASTAATTATPTVAPSSALASLPDVNLLLGTASGDVYRFRANSSIGAPFALCPGQNVVALQSIPGAARALALCARSASAKTALFVVELGPTLTARALALQPLDRADAVSVSPDGRSVAAIVPGTAGGSSVRVVSFDLSTGQETVLRPDENLTSDVLWTPIGLTVFRPGRGVGTGTLVLRNGAWQPFSDRQLGQADATRALVHLDASLFTGHGGHVVWERRGTTETQLTPNDSAYEFPLALLGDADAVVWRDLLAPDGRGQVVVYRGGRSVREDPGELCPRAERSGEWLLCVATRTQRLVGYSLATASFTRWAGSLPPSVSSFAIGP